RVWHCTELDSMYASLISKPSSGTCSGRHGSPTAGAPQAPKPSSAAKVAAVSNTACVRNTLTGFPRLLVCTEYHGPGKTRQTHVRVLRTRYVTNRPADF